MNEIEKLHGIKQLNFIVQLASQNVMIAGRMNAVYIVGTERATRRLLKILKIS